MLNWKTYRKKGVTPMRPHSPGENMTGISVSEEDGPKLDEPGGMIAANPDNPADKWYVAKDYFEANYEEVA